MGHMKCKSTIDSHAILRRKFPNRQKTNWHVAYIYAYSPAQTLQVILGGNTRSYAPEIIIKIKQFNPG